MRKNRNDKTNWDSTNIRLGTDPVKLQKMDKEGFLSPHLQVITHIIDTEIKILNETTNDSK